MRITETALSELLRKRDIFEIVDEEFHNATWLDASALLRSDSTLNDLYADKTVPDAVLDRIVNALKEKFPTGVISA